MIAFPLLERYLRQRLHLSPQANLQDSFYDELISFFPQLPDRITAKNFWQVYRNGILHEVTISKHDRSGHPMPVGSVSHDKPMLSLESDGYFWINPVLFSQHIIQTIEADFSVFEGTVALQSPLPKVKTISNTTNRMILGTSAE